MKKTILVSSLAALMLTGCITQQLKNTPLKSSSTLAVLCRCWGGVRNQPTLDHQARAVGGNLSNRNLRTVVRRFNRLHHPLAMSRRWILMMTSHFDLDGIH